MTAHAWWAPRFVTDDEADEGTEAEQIVPMVRVKGMSQKMCGYMNLVGYLEVAERSASGGRKSYRRMLTNKGPRHYAKCQYIDAKGINIFGESGIIVNPTLPKMMELADQARRKGQASARPTRTRRRKG